MLKSELRKAIRERKRRFTREELDEMALRITESIRLHPRFINAHTIMLYHSLPDEVNTHVLISSTKDKTILLPRVTGEGEMELRVYNGPDSLRQGAYGIMEPCGSIFTRYDEIELALIPGMAFDMRGNRLGRGKGYYDRFLPKLGKAYKIGVCFPFQLIDDVPTEPTDVAMDEVMWW